MCAIRERACARRALPFCCVAYRRLCCLLLSGLLILHIYCSTRVKSSDDARARRSNGQCMTGRLASDHWRTSRCASRSPPRPLSALVGNVSSDLQALPRKLSAQAIHATLRAESGRGGARPVDVGAPFSCRTTFDLTCLLHRSRLLFFSKRALGR